MVRLGGIARLLVGFTAWVAVFAAAPARAVTTGAVPGFHTAPVSQVPTGPALLDPDICRQSADLENALRECKKIIRRSELDGPPLAAYHNRCAEIELQLGRYDDAVADMERAVREDPGNRQYEANLALAKARAGR